MLNSRIVWSDQSGRGRNIFALFLRRFQLDTVPSTVTLLLFADSLYRLRVNGQIIGFGPARFLPAYPEYDSYELAPWLRLGENTVLVEVHSRGAACFQAMISRGGFVASGRVGLGDDCLDFSTPGDWQVCQADAWEAKVEAYSFAQGPIEVLDSRRQPTGYPDFLSKRFEEGQWHSPVVLTEQEDWGDFSPRSIPIPSLERVTPTTVALAASIKNGYLRQGFNAGNPRTKSRQPFFTHLFSDSEREMDIGVFWGPVSINGQELVSATCQLRGNRQNARVRLRAGWNFVYGLPELLRDCWTWLMEIPDAPGLLLRALPARECEFAFGLGTPQALPHEARFPQAPTCLEELAGYPDSWKLVPSDLFVCSPARSLAWDLPGECWQKNLPFREGLELPVEGEAATIVLDFGCEYLGHVSVDFETENGTILDVGYDERLNEQGTCPYFQSNPFINSADRCVADEGRHRFDAFHERGGRYLQLTFRGHPGRVKLHRAEVWSKCADQPVKGDFHCSDPLFNWLWHVGVKTVEACTIDGWIDCPWRERGMYLGDSLIQGHISRKFTDDTRIEAWSIRLWSRAQLANGQLPNVAPSEEHALTDYTLIWVVLLWNYWAATGDTALMLEVWPTVARIFDASAWKPAEGGLWEAHGDCKVFVDWGATREARQGTNGVLNAFRIYALECAAKMAAVLGHVEESRAYSADAVRVRLAFQDVLWDERHQRFAACRINGVLSETPALHVNTLALAYNLGTDWQQARVLDYLKREVRHNAQCAEGHLELYFLTFLLQGLYRVGEAGLAESVVREHYKLLRQHDAWTIWETLKNGLLQRNSLCHGWSCGPLIFFSERILGVRQDVPGDPSQMLVAPESDSLNEASGVVPHPQGNIYISWQVAGSKLMLALNVPDGVTVRVKPVGRLARLELVRVSATLPLEEELNGKHFSAPSEVAFANTVR